MCFPSTLPAETNQGSVEVHPIKAQKKLHLLRTALVTFDILAGHAVLPEATELARILWNDTHTLWCERSQEGSWFPTWYEVRDTLRPAWSGRLSDKCFSEVVHEFDSAVRSWQRVCRTNPRANPPGLALKPRPLTSAIKQNIKAIGPWTFRLALLGQQYNERHLVIQVKPRPGVKMRQVKLIQVRPDGSGTLTYYLDPPYSVSELVNLFNALLLPRERAFGMGQNADRDVPGSFGTPFFYTGQRLCRRERLGQGCLWGQGPAVQRRPQFANANQ